MVHALSEASRVLKHNGVVIDMRPVAAPSEVEVFLDEEWVGACPLDGSPGAADDDAVRRALAIFRSRCFALEAEEAFYSATYWDTAEGFTTYLKETGLRRVVTPPDDEFRKVERLMRQGGHSARIRLRDRMTIGRYRCAGGDKHDQRR